MSNRFYDTLKYITQFMLPALAGLYTTLAQIWGLPYSYEVSSTIMAVVAVLCTLLGITSVQYKRKELYNDTK